jgi:hypothetical protein
MLTGVASRAHRNGPQRPPNVVVKAHFSPHVFPAVHLSAEHLSVEHFSLPHAPVEHFDFAHSPVEHFRVAHFSAEHFSTEHFSVLHFSLLHVPVEHFSRETCSFSQHSSLSSHWPLPQAVFSALHFSLSQQAVGQSPPVHFAS